MAEATLQTIVLGAAAGGGLPQWNCGCANCLAARRGEIPAQTQSSLAVSGDGETWALLNASPDLRAQLAAVPALHPRTLRDSPLHSVLLTNGDLDHIAGLLSLRERQAFSLFATAEILEHLAANPVFAALDSKLVQRRAIALERPFALTDSVTATLFAVPGKVPLYLEGETVETALEGEQTVGVLLEAGGKRAYYIPGCAAMTPALAARLTGASLVFFDGTLWRDDEMQRLGLGAKTGRRMGHMPVSGAEGSLAAFAGLGVTRKVYVHLNNSNPLLRPGSPERREVEAAGWSVAHDGLAVTA
ncbi:MAG: pyrroloquinoline quinone biosynthesis protein PqqB [Rhodospirillales bacterium]